MSTVDRLTIPLDEIGTIIRGDGLGFIQPLKSGAWCATVWIDKRQEPVRNAIGPVEYAGPGEAWSALDKEIKNRTHITERKES